MDMKKIIDMFIVDGDKAREEFSKQLSNHVGKTVFGDDYTPDEGSQVTPQLEPEKIQQQQEQEQK